MKQEEKQNTGTDASVSVEALVSGKNLRKSEVFYLLICENDKYGNLTNKSAGIDVYYDGEIIMQLEPSFESEEILTSEWQIQIYNKYIKAYRRCT